MSVKIKLDQTLHYEVPITSLRYGEFGVVISPEKDRDRLALFASGYVQLLGKVTNPDSSEPKSCTITNQIEINDIKVIPVDIEITVKPRE